MHMESDRVATDDDERRSFVAPSPLQSDENRPIDSSVFRKRQYRAALSLDLTRFDEINRIIYGSVNKNTDWRQFQIRAGRLKADRRKAMLKLLAAALIASAAMIGTIRLADADPVTITFRFNDTEQEVRERSTRSRNRIRTSRSTFSGSAGRTPEPVPARGRRWARTRRGACRAGLGHRNG